MWKFLKKLLYLLAIPENRTKSEYMKQLAEVDQAEAIFETSFVVFMHFPDGCY